jgi:hypothetical protein
MQARLRRDAMPRPVSANQQCCYFTTRRNLITVTLHQKLFKFNYRFLFLVTHIPYSCQYMKYVCEPVRVKSLAVRMCLARILVCTPGFLPEDFYSFPQSLHATAGIGTADFFSDFFKSIF